MPVKKLETIDADTLLGLPYEPLPFLVEDLLPQGLHLLAGAPKIGKSWLALWLCLQVARGEPLWNFATKPCEVLYLCLEDSFQRIQSRLLDLTEDAPATLHFAVMSEQLHSGLVEQMEQFLQAHPATGLVVIDTLQRIRAAGNESNPYANDYRDIGVLKALLPLRPVLRRDGRPDAPGGPRYRSGAGPAGVPQFRGAGGHPHRHRPSAQSPGGEQRLFPKRQETPPERR